MVIPRVAFAVVLMVVALGLVVALAAQGRLEFAPRTEYFPPSFSKNSITCDLGTPDAPYRRTFKLVAEKDAEAPHWRAAHEPSLYLASRSPSSKVNRTYRLVWLRTFHAPITVRVEVFSDGTARLIAKRLSGQGGYEPGRIVDRVERVLSAEEFAKLERLVSETRPFDLPPMDCNWGSDGATWTLEANDAGAYKYVNRWSPKNGPVRDAGMLMLSFTGWRLGPIY